MGCALIQHPWHGRHRKDGRVKPGGKVPEGGVRWIHSKNLTSGRLRQDRAAFPAPDDRYTRAAHKDAATEEDSGHPRGRLPARKATDRGRRHATRPDRHPRRNHRIGQQGTFPAGRLVDIPRLRPGAPRSWSSPPSTDAWARSVPPPSPVCWSTLPSPCCCCASQPATASTNPSGSLCCSLSLRPPSCCLAVGWRSGWGCEARPSEELNTQVSCTDG